MVRWASIAAFVAAGFEHSIANMYFLPLAMLLQAGAGEPVQVAGLWRNLVPVIAGNLVGGSVLVALVYTVIYRRAAGLPGQSSAGGSSAQSALPAGGFAGEPASQAGDSSARRQ